MIVQFLKVKIENFKLYNLFAEVKFHQFFVNGEKKMSFRGCSENSTESHKKEKSCITNSTPNCFEHFAQIFWKWVVWKLFTTITYILVNAALKYWIILKMEKKKIEFSQLGLH